MIDEQFLFDTEIMPILHAENKAAEDGINLYDLLYAIDYTLEN